LEQYGVAPIYVEVVACDKDPELSSVMESIPTDKTMYKSEGTLRATEDYESETDALLKAGSSALRNTEHRSTVERSTKKMRKASRKYAKEGNNAEYDYIITDGSSVSFAIFVHCPNRFFVTVINNER
uniref:Ecotin n=1 Tax=Gongylonema pulchrum TaxID=637853 RepID=A0A183EZ21_9BILA